MNSPGSNHSLHDGAEVCADCGTAQDAADAPSGTNTLHLSASLTRRVLDNKYELGPRIGEGGMGVIYRARRVHIGDEVAVKVLRQRFLTENNSVERFRREARAAAQLHHRNVVVILDYGDARDTGVPAYIVMELIEGESLRSLLHAERRLSPSRAVSLMLEICAGVGAAHARGVIHRDLKPENVIVLPPDDQDRHERVKVVDFGMAKLRDSASVSTLTPRGDIVGTPRYISPEQCRGESSDERADVYSLGVMLYEMIKGAPPFEADTLAGLISKHRTEKPPPLAAEHGVSPALWSVIRRALAKDPSHRQSDATDFARTLREAEEASHDNPRVVGSRAFMAAIRDRLKNRRVLLAASALVVLMVAVPVWLLRVGSSESAQRALPPMAPIDERRPGESSAPGAVNGVTPPAGMVYVRGGEFMMGRDSGDDYERPAHRVKVQPFFMDTYEVTCAEYERFVKETGHQAPQGWRNGVCPPGAIRKPITGVTWDDASAYARWAGKRLPTEEEWEFAVRGTDGLLYPWGNDWKRGSANAHAEHKTAVDVGTYRGESPFGAFDLIGNVWEWTASTLKAYEGGRLPKQKAGELKVIRGGSYLESKDQATTTYRRGYPARGNYNYSRTGFRCVKELTNLPQ